MPPSRPCAVWTITALTRLKAQGMYKVDALKSSATSRIIFQPSDPGAQCVRLWSEWQAAGPARQPRQPRQACAPMQSGSAGAGPPAAEAAVKAEAKTEPAQALRHLSSGTEQCAPEVQWGGGQERESAAAGVALQIAPAEQPAMAAGKQSAQELAESNVASAAATCQLAALGADAGEAQYTSAQAPPQTPAMLHQADLDRPSADPVSAAPSCSASLAQQDSSAPAISLRTQQDRPDASTAQERAEGMQGSAAEQGFSQASTVLYAPGTREHGPQLSLSHRQALTAFSQTQCPASMEQPSHSSDAPCGQPLHSSGTPAENLGESHTVKHGYFALPRSQPGQVPIVGSSAGPSTSQVRSHQEMHNDFPTVVMCRSGHSVAATCILMTPASGLSRIMECPHPLSCYHQYWWP